MIRITVALLLLATTATAAPPTIPEAVKLRVRQKVDNGYTPGISVCMLNADGRTFYNYGKTSHQPDAPQPDETTLFEIASVTKTFTTTLLAQMVEAGDVALSDTAASLLPPGVNMPANGGDTITLEQLANHTSAIPSAPPNLPATITDLDNQFANYTTAHLYEFLNTYTLTRAPGTDYEYSNAAIALLGHCLALSQGTDYESLLRQRVLDPMGLSDTAISLSEFQTARYAKGHHGVVERPPFEMNIVSPAGGLKSCAIDLATYLEYQLGISTSDITPAIELSHQLSYNLPTASGYDQALGWWLFQGGDIVQHGGDSFGSTAFIGVRKSTNTGVIILSNNRSHFPASVTQIGFHCLNPANPPDDVPEAEAISQQFLREHAGDYGTVRISQRLGRPVFEVPGQTNYTAYSNRSGGLAVLDIGLQINMSFNTDPVSGDVVSMSFRQNDSAEQVFTRIRHPADLTITHDHATSQIQLQATGEADRNYPLEQSSDLKNWTPMGTIHIWEDQTESTTTSANYFRIREP